MATQRFFSPGQRIKRDGTGYTLTTCMNRACSPLDISCINATISRRKDALPASPLCLKWDYTRQSDDMNCAYISMLFSIYVGTARKEFLVGYALMIHSLNEEQKKFFKPRKSWKFVIFSSKNKSHTHWNNRLKIEIQFI